MPVNCLRASKLVTLGYEFDNALFDKCLQYFCLNIQQVILRVLNIKLKNLAFDASKIITNAMFSIDNLRKEVNTISNYGQHHRDVYVQTRKNMLYSVTIYLCFDSDINIWQTENTKRTEPIINYI